MTLKLREGWEETIDQPSGWRWFHRSSGSWEKPYAVDTGKGQVFTYAHGVAPCCIFFTVEKAHAYLVEMGSESPWEEVC